MSDAKRNPNSEANRRISARRESIWQAEGLHLDYAWERGFEEGFIDGAQWAEPQDLSTLPERFRDPTALARFIIGNEWALDSEVNPSGLADWEETLRRVFDNWDADTPGDIVSTIAAAIRLDRSFRGTSREAEAWDEGMEAGQQAILLRAYTPDNPYREGDRNG